MPEAGRGQLFTEKSNRVPSIGLQIKQVYVIEDGRLPILFRKHFIVSSPKHYKVLAEDC